MITQAHGKNPDLLIWKILFILVGICLVVTGGFVLFNIFGLAEKTTLQGAQKLTLVLTVTGFGIVLLLCGVLLHLGIGLKKLTYGSASIELSQTSGYTESTTIIAEHVQQKTLDQKDIEERESYAETKVLPGRSVPDFTATQLTQFHQLLVRPSAHPMTPMYVLDKNFRIIDWNEAFSLAFDRTMEGRQGQSVLEWTYHLDNYQEILDHGESAFTGSGNLPVIDVETVEYTSLRYGPISAVKRAFQVPDDKGKCFGWLITMDMDFTNPNEQSRFKYELLRLNGLEQLWSEYAVSYDRVLTNTRIYRDLLDTLLGTKGDLLQPIDLEAKVLDAGAGTGNLSLRLMEGNSKRTIFAVEKNRIMLEFLRDKCKSFLREDDQKPGILAVKQDISSLYGFPDNYFDCVLANNVFYALTDPEACLESIMRVLKPGGELRMTGPRADTSLDILFQKIKSDLENEGKFIEFQAEYKHVEQINKLRLTTMLHKWTTEDFCALLISKGFVVTHSSNEIYANQSMLVSAIKPFSDVSQPKFSFNKHVDL